jgi:hypothetical protein
VDTLTDRLAASGWQPRWYEPGVRQPTVAVELDGRVWGWDPEEWETVCAELARHNQAAMARARKASSKPLGKGRQKARSARTDQPGLF